MIDSRALITMIFLELGGRFESTWSIVFDKDFAIWIGEFRF